ncbi:conserved hypothetical protein [Ricinus communis]|uniref:Uncharacterized protein n=1 Tax=Ricinus communis TaxID=3988 RepID=B9TLB3_RICCO|nr:conserved hypothetical protein [Ricinus communis]
MLRFGGQLELAMTSKTAIDGFFAHQPLHRIDAGVEGAVEPVGPFDAQALRQGGVILSEAVIAHAAIAPGRRAADDVRLADDHTRTLARQRQRGGRSGDAATDHDDVASALRQRLGLADEGGRGIQPIGLQLHHGRSRRMSEGNMERVPGG